MRDLEGAEAMKLDEITVKKDEYYTPPYAIEPILKYVPTGAKVWCPFDTEESLFVKMLRRQGHEVIATHIDNGGDFFALDIPCDCIISNPPYSMKAEVFERLFALGKPFAMLVGVVGLFESQRRFDMFRNNPVEIMWLSKRVSFFEDYADQKPALNPPFSSIYLASRMLPDRMVFEEIDKRRVVLSA